MESKIVENRIKELLDMKEVNKNDLANSLKLTPLKLEKKLNGEEEFYISEMMKIKELFNLNLEVFEKLFFEEDFNLSEFMTNLDK